MALQISRMTLIKGAILTFLLTIVLILRIWPVPEDQSGKLVVETGYFILALNYILFLYSLVWIVPGIQLGSLITRHAPGILICIGLTFVIHCMEPHRFKVLNDEFALLNNSMAMHLHQKAGLMGQADLIDGHLVHPSITADKRSLSFQFLLSLVHRILGYRPNNAFLLNGFLTIGFFLTLYGFLNRLQGNRTLSICGVLLAASIPLIAHVATSGAYDLLNVTLILLFMLAGSTYIQSPDTNRQAMFVMTGLLLAQTRYESLLYLLSLGLVTLVVWIKAQKINLSWVSAISPVFLFIPLMANAHMFAHEILQDGSVRSSTVAFMSFSHLPGNLLDATKYFFSPRSSATNSVVVSLFSLCGLIWLSFAIVKRQDSIRTPSFWMYLATLPVTMLCFLVMTTNFWGKLTDPMASRFAMPLYLMGVIAGVLGLKSTCRRNPLQKWVLAGCGMLLATVSMSRIFGYTHTPPMVQSEYQQWLLEFAESKGDEPLLFSCDGTLGLVAFNKAVIPVKALNISPDAIARIMESGLYEAIYVFDLAFQDPISRNWFHTPGSASLNTSLYSAKIEEEVYFSNSARARAYRLTGIYAH